MLTFDIPGQGLLRLEHLVLDYNGTLALDGELLPGVAPRLAALARSLSVHVVTADTFGTVAARVAGLPVALRLLPPGGQDQAKRDFVLSLGADRAACLGNGRNDALMLREAALGRGHSGPGGGVLRGPVRRRRGLRLHPGRPGPAGQPPAAYGHPADLSAARFARKKGPVRPGPFSLRPPAAHSKTLIRSMHVFNLIIHTKRLM